MEIRSTGKQGNGTVRHGPGPSGGAGDPIAGPLLVEKNLRIVARDEMAAEMVRDGDSSRSSACWEGDE